MLIDSTNGWEGLSRTRLRRSTLNARADLLSKGTLDDPTAKKIGWTLGRLDGFERRLASHPQETLGEIHHSLKAEAREKAAGARRALWCLAAGVGLGVATLALPLAPMVTLAGMGAAALGVAFSAGNYLKSDFETRQVEQAATDLANWGRALEQVCRGELIEKAAPTTPIEIEQKEEFIIIGDHDVQIMSA